MQEMDRRVALLRLLLADITAREQQARDAQGQLRGQLTRIVDFTVRQNAGVSHALSSMDEVEERLAQQERMLRHLSLLRVRAQGELEALVVTRGVSDARARLAELEQRRAQLVASDQESTAGELAEIDAEVAELQAMIQQASEAAARALTQATQGPEEPRAQSRRESRPR
jgi:uncharacterized coiled-coil protein SlyX